MRHGYNTTKPHRQVMKRLGIHMLARLALSLKLTLLVIACVIVLTVLMVANGQKRGGRDGPGPQPSPPPIGPTGPRIPKPKPTPVKRAELTVYVPSGCRVWLNDNEVELRNSLQPINLNGQKITTSYAANSGVVTIKGLKPGPYRVTGRKPNYQDFNKDLSLLIETENVVTIVLTPITGRLTVKPSAPGSSVEVFNIEESVSVGSYSGYIENLVLTPGNYRINTSKEGHRTAVREIVVKPGESVYLEPVVEILPKPAPTPNRRPLPPVIPATFTIDIDGKDVILAINGSTGDTAAGLGTITAQIGGPDHGVVGSFNGMPCLVEFVKLENVVEGAVVESPGPTNSWAKIVVRVRPKDRRRPLSFAINWRSLAASGLTVPAESRPEQLVHAEAIQKVLPVVPPVARFGPRKGTVKVLIFISDSGSVISAKALDGPMALRQPSEEAARKWKFRPAIRNGKPVESEQTIQFTFEN